VRTIEDFLVHFRRQRDWTHSLVAVVREELGMPAIPG